MACLLGGFRRFAHIRRTTTAGCPHPRSRSVSGNPDSLECLGHPSTDHALINRQHARVIHSSPGIRQESIPQLVQVAHPASQCTYETGENLVTVMADDRQRKFARKIRNAASARIGRDVFVPQGLPTRVLSEIAIELIGVDNKETFRVYGAITQNQFSSRSVTPMVLGSTDFGAKALLILLSD